MPVKKKKKKKSTRQKVKDAVWPASESRTGRGGRFPYLYDKPKKKK